MLILFFSHQVMSDSATPWITGLLCSWGSPGKSTGVGMPFSSPGDLPRSGIKPESSALAGGFFTAEPPREASNVL